MPRIKVVVADPIHPAGLQHLKAHYDLAFLPEIEDPGERSKAIAEAEAIVVRVFRVDESLLAVAPALRLVAKHGSGVDNIDIAAASRRGVLVANTPGGANATAVAEGAVTLMLAVLRQVRAMDACVREERFQERWKLSLFELWGKRLGLVGFGKIARVTAQICRAGFNMDVSVYDPFVSAVEIAASGCSKAADLMALVGESDVLSVHVPLSNATHHLVNAEVIAALPKTAIVVNTSRGGLIDEAALVNALRKGCIAGAGLDVFEQEPPTADNPLLQLDNVVLSPHVAGVTEESLRGMAFGVADVLDSVFTGRRPATLLNGEIWEHLAS